MKIAIVGCGAAGSVFAAYLKNDGDEIYMIDLNKAHMDAVAQNGLIFRYPDGESLLTGFHTSTNADGIGVCDVVIVVVKSFQTESAVKLVSPCIGENTVLMSLQNGLGNDEELNRFVPADRILYGAGRIGTELPKPGVCVAKPFKGVNMVFGPMQMSERNREVGEHIAACFDAGGLEPEFSEDVRSFVWKKSANNMGFNSVCAVLGLKIREVAEDECGKKLVDNVMREVSSVAKVRGVHDDLYPILIKEVPNTIKNLGDYYPSMAQDVVLYNRQSEVDSMVGRISMYGKEYGIPTPTCDTLTLIIHAIQGNYDTRYKG